MGSGGVPSGGSSSSGGTGGMLPPGETFCADGFGSIEHIDLWASSQELFVVLHDAAKMEIWSRYLAGGSWQLIWQEDGPLYGVPSLTGFPEDGPLVLYGLSPCGIQFLQNGELTCSGAIAPVYDVHVVGAGSAYATTGDTVLRYTGSQWQFESSLSMGGEAQLATSVWADADSLFVTTDAGGSGRIYTDRDDDGTLQGELEATSQLFTNVEATEGSEWLLTRSGDVYVHWDGGNKWYLNTFFDQECSSFRELWIAGPARYMRTSHSFIRSDEQSAYWLLDLPCDGATTIAAATSDGVEKAYVALLDASLETTDCRRVSVIEWNGVNWQDF